MKKKDRKKFNTSLQKDIIWNKILEHLQQNKFNDAYLLALIGSNSLLEKLMATTGICCNFLEPTTIHLLLSKVNEKIKQKKDVRVLILWVSQILELGIEFPCLEDLKESFAAYLEGEEEVEESLKE